MEYSGIYSGKGNELPDFIGLGMNSIKNNDHWNILEKTTGDLNKDGHDDLAFILESKDSIFEKRCENCKLLKNKPRIKIVALNENGSITSKIQNNKVIARGDERGMLPYFQTELSMEKGSLTIYYQCIRSNQSYISNLDNGQMSITSAESSGVHQQPESTKIRISIS